MNSLSKKVAIVSAAGRGIGRGIAISLAEAGATVIEVACRCVRLDDTLPLVRYLIPFKLFTRVLLRSTWLAARFHRMVKARKVTGLRKVDLRLERTIRVQDGHIAVRDVLRLGGPGRVTELTLSRDATVVHSASSRYAGPADLGDNLVRVDASDRIEELNTQGRMCLERELLVD